MNVSHSELACYQACPRKWYMRYRLRRSGLVSAERLARGKRIHSALAAFWQWPGANIDMFEESLQPLERAMFKGYYVMYREPPFVARVNVPFDVEISPGVHIVGEVDAVGEDEQGPVVVEHKTTTSDIEPGSSYWRRAQHCDRQVAIYSLAFPRARVFYDVLRVPQFRAGDVYAKSLDAMANAPEKYFQRAWVVRTEQELEDAKEDIEELVWQMQFQTWEPERNPQSCHAYGDECEFFAVCWQGRDPMTMPEWDDPSFECQRGKT